ncbi:MAG: LytTR family transcriptional regulator DNA-binding domain-containing protein [Bacilli bacterium]|nr:LytTR family transcriptional regulator DNA-binding domain-containing protein [Bacilli bacterium]
MINVIICDDNEKDRIYAEKTTKKFMDKNKKEYKIYSFDDYNKSFYSIVSSKIPTKIYLLDIETPSRSGIDVAREIRRKDIDSVIIFLTAHEELGNIVLKNDLLFLSFINKFDNFENRLINSLEKSLDLLNKKNTIRFTDRNVLYTININDILYLTKDSFERKTIIKTDYTEFKVSKPLIEMIEMLDDRFVQTHRACYINSDRKVMVDKSNKIITFDNGETIDLLSDKYRKAVI